MIRASHLGASRAEGEGDACACLAATGRVAMWGAGAVWGATFEPTDGGKDWTTGVWRQKMRAMSASSAPLHFYVCLHVQVPAICH